MSWSYKAGERGVNRVRALGRRRNITDEKKEEAM